MSDDLENELRKILLDAASRVETVDVYEQEVASSLMYHLRSLIDIVVDEYEDGKHFRQGANFGSFHAFSGYICAVAAVESFVNNVFLSKTSQEIMPESCLWTLHISEVNRWRLEDKLLNTPQMLFGQTFEKGKQPFQDMKSLISVRNYLVHNKARQHEDPPKCIKPLEQKGIFLHDIGGIRLSPLIKMSCSQGLLWAYNTACKTIQTLLSFAPQQYQRRAYSDYYSPLPENYISIKLQEKLKL